MPAAPNGRRSATGRRCPGREASPSSNSIAICRASSLASSLCALQVGLARPSVYESPDAGPSSVVGLARTTRLAFQTKRAGGSPAAFVSSGLISPRPFGSRRGPTKTASISTSGTAAASPATGI